MRKARKLCNATATQPERYGRAASPGKRDSECGDNASNYNNFPSVYMSNLELRSALESFGGSGVRGSSS